MSYTRLPSDENYCAEHGTFIGPRQSADYLCGPCEDGDEGRLKDKDVTACGEVLSLGTGPAHLAGCRKPPCVARRNRMRDYGLECH